MSKFLKVGFALFLLGLLILGIVLLTLPASVAYRVVSSRLPPGIALSGLQGSVWDGRAEQLQFNGSALGALSWHIPKATPITAKLSLSGTDASGSATVGVKGSSVYAARDVQVQAPARLLEKALGLPGFQFTGQIVGQFKTLDVRLPNLFQAAGEVVWTDAGLQLPYALRLGTYVLTLQPTESGARGVISDRGGDLAVSGDVEWIGSRYRANVRLQARSGPEELARALNYIGAPNLDGSRQLLIEGDLL